MSDSIDMANGSSIGFSEGGSPIQGLPQPSTPFASRKEVDLPDDDDPQTRADRQDDEFAKWEEREWPWGQNF